MIASLKQHRYVSSVKSDHSFTSRQLARSQESPWLSITRVLFQNHSSRFFGRFRYTGTSSPSSFFKIIVFSRAEDTDRAAESRAWVGELGLRAALPRDILLKQGSTLKSSGLRHQAPRSYKEIRSSAEEGGFGWGEGDLPLLLHGSSF